MGVIKMVSKLRSIRSSFTGTLVCWWICGLGFAGAAVVCPSPGNQDGGNVTSFPADGQTTVRQISCTRGCCPGSADGCCYRTTDDVVVYSVPISVCTVLCVITIGFVYRHVRTKRINRVNQARLQAGMDKTESPLSPDNPPSYSSCVVEPVSSTTNLTVHDVDDVIEVVIHATAQDVEVDLPLSPPPVYDDVFKSGDEDQVAVISPRGHVSFVDHNLLPPSVCCHGGRDGCVRPGWHSPRLCHVTVSTDHTADNCHDGCHSPLSGPRLAHFKGTEDQGSRPGSNRSLRLCHVKEAEDHATDSCYSLSPSSSRSLRLCHVKVTDDYGINNCHGSSPSSSRSLRLCHVTGAKDNAIDNCLSLSTNSSRSLHLCHVKVNNDHGSENDYTINPSSQIKDHVYHAASGEVSTTKLLDHVSCVTGSGDDVGEKTFEDIQEGDDVKAGCSTNALCLMTASGEDVPSGGVTNEACTDISCGR